MEGRGIRGSGATEAGKGSGRGPGTSAAQGWALEEAWAVGRGKEGRGACGGRAQTRARTDPNARGGIEERSM